MIWDVCITLPLASSRVVILGLATGSGPAGKNGDVLGNIWELFPLTSDGGVRGIEVDGIHQAGQFMCAHTCTFGLAHIVHLYIRFSLIISLLRHIHTRTHARAQVTNPALMAERCPLIDITSLKFRERDELEGIFKVCLFVCVWGGGALASWGFLPVRNWTNQITSVRYTNPRTKCVHVGTRLH